MKLESPLHLQILIHCYSRAEPHPNVDTELGHHLHKELIDAEVIAKDETLGCYRTTDLGNAWVKLLLDTPSPNRAFIDHHGNVLK